MDDDCPRIVKVRTPGTLDFSGSSDGDYDRGTKSFSKVHRGSKTAKAKQTKSPQKKKTKKPTKPLTDELPAEKIKTTTKKSRAKRRRKSSTPETSFSSS